MPQAHYFGFPRPLRMRYGGGFGSGRYGGGFGGGFGGFGGRFGGGMMLPGLGMGLGMMAGNLLMPGSFGFGGQILGMAGYAAGAALNYRRSNRFGSSYSMGGGMPYGGGYDRPYGPAPFRYGSSFSSPMGMPGEYPRHWASGGYFPQERPYYMPTGGTWQQHFHGGAWHQPYGGGMGGGMGGEYPHASGASGAGAPPANQPERPDWRSILGLGPNATVADVKKAYKTEALKCHPDKGPASEKEEREEKFNALGKAKEAAFEDLGYTGT